MAKRKRDSALGHDPFAEFDVFDIEGPVPADEPVPPPPSADPVPKEVTKPTVKAPIFTAKPAPASQAHGDSNGRAFSIADFLSPVKKKQEVEDVEEPATSEEPVQEEATATDAVSEEVEDFGQEEQIPSVVEDEEQPAALEEPLQEEATATDAVSEEAKVLPQKEQIPFVVEDEEQPAALEEPLQEEATVADTFPEEFEDLEQEEQILSILEEKQLADTPEDSVSLDPPQEIIEEVTASEPAESEPIDLTIDEEPAFDIAGEEAETSFLFAETESEENVLMVEEIAAELPAAEPVVSELDTTAATGDIAGITPSESELQGLLDTAELALAEEHRAALDALEAIHDQDDSLAFEDDFEEDKEDFLIQDGETGEDDQTFDTVIDEDNSIWGATAPLDPDLGMNWEAEEEEEPTEELPNWLTADVSAIKLDTGMLQPITLNEEDFTSDPDLHIDWEENSEEESLPNWLTAETSASRIDTDKLKPVALKEETETEEAEETEEVVPAVSEQPEDENRADAKPIQAESDESDYAWLERNDDHLWHTKQLSPDPEEDTFEETYQTAKLSPDNLPFDDQAVESDDEATRSDMPPWMKAHLQSGRTTSSQLDFPAPMEEDYFSLTEDSAEPATVSEQALDFAEEPADTAADLWANLPEDDTDHAADMADSLAENNPTEVDLDWALDEASDTIDSVEENNIDFGDFDVDVDDTPEIAESVEESADDFDWNLDEEFDAADFDSEFNDSADPSDPFVGDTTAFDWDFAEETDEPQAEEEVAPANPSELTEPSEALNTEKLPGWLKTEDSFTLFSDDEEEEERLLAEDLDEEATLPPVEPAFAESEVSADGSLEFLDEEDVFGFDFDFYEVENETPVEAADGVDIEFDDTAFDVGEIEDKPATQNVDLNDLLSKYSSLPTTQILSSPLPYENEQTEADEPLADVLDENLLFDFDFDQVEEPVEEDPFSFDDADPFGSFEIEDLDEDIDVDALLDRYSEPTQEPAASSPSSQPSPPEERPTTTPLIPTFMTADTDPLTQLLVLIDSEMEPLQVAATPTTAPPESTLPAPEPTQSLPTPVEPAEDVEEMEIGTAVEEYVVFKIAMTSYAISLDNVQEITPAPQTTYVPNVPSWVIGVTNLHGEIFSVIDLRRFLKLPWIEAMPEQRMLAVYDNRQEIRTGLLVDGVTAIKKLSSDEIQPMGSELNTLVEAVRPYASGRYQDVIILSLNDLLMSKEMRQFEPTR